MNTERDRTRNATSSALLHEMKTNGSQMGADAIINVKQDTNNFRTVSHSQFSLASWDVFHYHDRNLIMPMCVYTPARPAGKVNNDLLLNTNKGNLNVKTQTLIAAGKKSAIAIMILGGIHDVATFTPIIQEGIAPLAPDDYLAVIYMSLICGTSLILCGGLAYAFLNNFAQIPYLKTPLVAIGVFLGINGILSVAFMNTNPFAWIALLLNGMMCAITINLRRA